jgi:hypothetical protein
VLGGPCCNVQSHTLLQTCCILWDFPSKVCKFEAVSCISRELCHCMVRGGIHAYDGSGIALLFAHRSRSTTQSRSEVSCSQVGPVVPPVHFWCCDRRLSFGAHDVSLVAHTLLLAATGGGHRGCPFTNCKTLSSGFCSLRPRFAAFALMVSFL